MRTIGAGVGAGIGVGVGAGGGAEIGGETMGGITIAGGMTAGARGCLVKLENNCEKGVGEAAGLGSAVMTGG